MNILEILNKPSNIHQFSWQMKTDKKWTANFEINNRKFLIIFQNISVLASPRESYWRVDFKRENYNGPGTMDDTVKVMDIVASIIYEFLNAIEPLSLLISPSNRKREKLFNVIIKRMMSTIDHAYYLEKDYDDFILKRLPNSDDLDN